MVLNGRTGDRIGEGGDPDPVSEPDWPGLTSEWNAVLQGTQAAGKDKSGQPNKFSFDHNLADDAVRACNSLLEYLNGVNGKLPGLKLDWSAVNGIESTNALCTQFNEWFDTNVAQVIARHQNIVETMIKAFENAGSTIEATDSNSAAAANSANATADPFQALVTNENTFLDSLGKVASGDGGDPMSGFTVGDPSISMPTDHASDQAWTSTTWGTPSSWNKSAIVSQDTKVYSWTTLPTADSTDFMLDGMPHYSGQVTSEPRTADLPPGMQWPDLHQLSQLNPQPMADIGRDCTYLAGQLKEGFTLFSTYMKQALDPAQWSGNGAQAAAAAVKDYLSTWPDLIEGLQYAGWSLGQAARWLSTTKAYMPMTQTPPSASALPANVTTPGGVQWSVHGGSPNPSESVAPHVVTPAGEISVLYQGGLLQGSPQQVDSQLLQYYQEQYGNWYYYSYNFTSSNVPALTVPASAAAPGGPADSGGGGGGDTSTQPVIEYVSYGGGGGMGSLSEGGSGNLPPDLASLLNANQGNNAGSPGTSQGGDDPGSPGTPETPIDPGSAGAGTNSDPAGNLLGDVQQAAGAAQQVMSAAQQTPSQMSGSPQQQLEDLEQQEKAALEAEESSTRSPGAPLDEVGDPVPDAVESQPDTTSALFPRPAAADANETAVGRAGLASTDVESPPGAYPPGMGSPAAAGRGNEQKVHRKPGYLNSRRHLNEALGEAPLTSVPLIEER